MLTYLVAGAFFMENLDATVITTAVPAMATSFGVAPTALSTGISAYLVALSWIHLMLPRLKLWGESIP